MSISAAKVHLHANLILRISPLSDAVDASGGQGIAWLENCCVVLK